MKIYLAAVESGNRESVRDLIENAFYSYYYLKQKKNKLTKRKMP